MSYESRSDRARLVPGGEIKSPSRVARSAVSESGSSSTTARLPPAGGGNLVGVLLLLLILLVAGLVFIAARPRVGDGVALLLAIFAALIVVLLAGADGVHVR